MLPEDIFKRYDIRGRYPQDINIENVVKIIQAYVFLFKPEQIVVGHDSLEGSKLLYPSVCSAFALCGVDVYQIGLCTSPMVAFASAHYNVIHAIMLTASHLGDGYTGIKAIHNGIPPAPEEMLELKKIALSDNEINLSVPSPGELTTLHGFIAAYKDMLLQLVDYSQTKHSYKVVFDLANGGISMVLADLTTRLGIKAHMINSDILYSHLAHGTNPKIAKNRTQLLAKVKHDKADLGVMWDGDGDRAYFVDSEGQVIPPEYIGAKIGSYLVTKNVGNKVTVDVRGSTAYADIIEAAGGNVLRIQSWHVPIKQLMEQDSEVIFGMEVSGHYVFRDFYKIDDGLLASLIFISAISKMAMPLAQDLAEFRQKYKIVEEINFKTTKSETQLVQQVQEYYKDGIPNTIDGLSIDYPDWRFNIRSSRTEPIIRLCISGTNFELVDQNLEFLKSVIGGSII